MFRGREIVHAQVGRDLLQRVEERLGDFSIAESRPRMEGRTLSFTLAPNRPAIEKLKAKEQAAREREAKSAEETQSAEN